MRRASRARSVSLLGLGLVVVIVALAAFAAGSWLFTERLPGAFGPPPSAGPLPSFGRVYLIVLENHPYDEVIRDSDAPYLNSLAGQGALATAYYAVERPSQPNYIALFSGDTHGMTDNNVQDLGAPNLADQLEAGGRTWSVTAENVPDGCFAGEFASDGRDGPGTYARKHEPAISFTSISGNPARCGRIHDLTAFDPAEADFQLIVPNLCHKAHDCDLSVADQFLAGFVPRILDSAAFQDRGVLFITFDEGDRDDARIPLIVVGQGVRPGTRSADVGTHYAWLRTVQDAWGLSCLAKSCDAGNLSGLFQASG